MRSLLLVVGFGVGLIVLAANLVDEGEVVVLVTKDAGGIAYETPLWIVDLDGKLFLRAGSPSSRWLERIRENPDVIVERDEEKLAFLAVPESDPATRTAVNERMNVKYGFADRMWSRLLERDRAIPILLEPRAAP